MDRWEKQSSTIRNAQNEVKKTERAIEREEGKLAEVEYANGKLPQYVLDMVVAGEITQWRKHPNTFFVPCVDKGRVFVDLDTGRSGCATCTPFQRTNTEVSRHCEQDARQTQGNWRRWPMISAIGYDEVFRIAGRGACAKAQASATQWNATARTSRAMVAGQ